MEFCPFCANLLQYENRIPARLFCRTCPYVCPLMPKTKIKRAIPLRKKDPTPAPGETTSAPAPAPAAGNISSLASCPKCHHDKAAYEQVQTRSSDEAMTLFYKCLNDDCENLWREEP